MLPIFLILEALEGFSEIDPKFPLYLIADLTSRVSYLCGGSRSGHLSPSETLKTLIGRCRGSISCNPHETLQRLFLVKSHLFAAEKLFCLCILLARAKIFPLEGSVTPSSPLSTLPSSECHSVAFFRPGFETPKRQRHDSDSCYQRVSHTFFLTTLSLVRGLPFLFV